MVFSPQEIHRAASDHISEIDKTANGLQKLANVALQGHEPNSRLRRIAYRQKELIDHAVSLLREAANTLEETYEE